MVRLSLYNRGLFCGAQAIRWELDELVVRPLPSMRTINRILARNELTRRRTGRYQPTGRKYPALRAEKPGDVHQSDFVGPCFLRGPVRFYSLHSVDLATHRCAVEPLLSREGQHTVDALWASWLRLGMPKHQQVDNEMVFYGSPAHPRGMGLLIRLCLPLGIEPILVADQAVQMGMHHDGIHYYALDGSSTHGLLVMNHEYTDDGLLHPDGMKTWSAEKVRKAQAAPVALHHHPRVLVVVLEVVEPAELGEAAPVDHDLVEGGELEDAAVEPGVWKTLKRSLKTGRMTPETFEPFPFFSVSGLKPEPIEIRTKVIVLRLRNAQNLDASGVMIFEQLIRDLLVCAALSDHL